MKTFTTYALTAVLLIGLMASASAQNNIVTTEQANIWNAMRQRMHSDSLKRNMVNELLSGSGMGHTVSGLLRQNDFREGLGISQEQNQKIQEGLRNIDQTISTQGESDPDPDYKLLLDADQELRRSFNEAVRANAAPDVLEEIHMNRLDLQEKMWDVQSKKRVSLFNEILTSDQMKRIQEFHISTMSETNFVFPQMFEALDLSDEQKEQLDEIKKDIKPEFEKHIAKQVEFESKHGERLTERARELVSIRDQEERQRLFDDFHRRLRADMQPEWNAVMESGRELADKLKIEMFDVLTDEQWDRMLDLIDNPPDYVKRWLAKAREANRGAMERDNVSAGGWAPGPNSWQPGDPIPEAYRIERQTRGNFPRPRQPSP